MGGECDPSRSRGWLLTDLANYYAFKESRDGEHTRFSTGTPPQKLQALSPVRRSASPMKSGLHPTERARDLVNAVANGTPELLSELAS